jgi:hypothetical protein
MAYYKGIVVTIRHGVNPRRAILNLGDSDIPNSVFLSYLNLNEVQSRIDELTEVIANPNGGLYWGQPQITISSDPEMSDCFNEMDQVPLPSVPTQDLLNLMVEIKNFKQVYEDPDHLNDIVGQAFTAIKSNPNSHKKYPNSDDFFQAIINGMEIILTLAPGDFNLTESEYVSQLKVE